MKVAILGTRGIPAAYSGFETAAEHIAAGLTERGHDVTVYCRTHVVDSNLQTYRGAKLVHLPTIQSKYLDTFVHTAISAKHAVRVERPDVALYFIAGNSPLMKITRDAGIPSVINIDGLDSDRAKWPSVAKRYLRHAERTSPRNSDITLTDSHSVAELFEDRYGERIEVIPYGVSDPGYTSTDQLDALGLKPDEYILYVGRLEPENNPHMLVDAFSRIPFEVTGNKKLVIVGDAPYAKEFIQKVHRGGDPRVIFPGYIFGKGYWELQKNSYLTVVPTEVGGTHPVILEALAAGACVLVNNHKPNLETVGTAAASFDGAEGVPALQSAMTDLLLNPEKVKDLRAKAVERARDYSWDVVTDQYEQLLIRAVEGSGAGHLDLDALRNIASANLTLKRALRLT